MFPETFNELLMPAVLVGIFVSVVLSNIDSYNILPAEIQRRIVGVLTILVTAAIAAFNYFVPEGVALQIGDYYLVIRPLLELLFSGSAAVYTGSQVWYRVAGKPLFADISDKAA